MYPARNLLEGLDGMQEPTLICLLLCCALADCTLQLASSPARPGCMDLTPSQVQVGMDSALLLAWQACMCLEGEG